MDEEKNMKILVTGNLGYIGSVLGKYLKDHSDDIHLIGIDLGFFANRLTGLSISPDVFYDEQHYVDVRELPSELLEGVDVVVHLAAISNDPMGAKFDVITDSINHQSSTRLAKLSSKMGVKHFLFASSCSVYGAGGNNARSESDSVSPLTAYAHSKINTEISLAALSLDSMKVTCMRFATACGYSPRTRLDLVLNDFVSKAIFEKRIEILSDGTPWRPLITVRDMCQAMFLLIKHRSERGNPLEIMNVGSSEWNYMVKDLAYAVKEHFDDVDVSINSNAAPDKRSYKVNFDKFNEIVKGEFKPQNINEAILELKNGLVNFSKTNNGFNIENFIRLKTLEENASHWRLI